MARYDEEFSGISARFGTPRGLDPNYADGYTGMRMRGGHGKAAYGTQRLQHEQDLETEGGFHGIHPGDGTPVGIADESGVLEGGNDAAARLRLLRDFNAHSPEFAEPQLLRDDEQTREGQKAMVRPDWAAQRGYRGGYTNRGVTEAGYSEGWAYGPMRGAR